MNKRIILFVILFCLIFAGVIPINMGAVNENQYSARAGSKGLTVHEPIHIYGNDDFTEENGVVNGSGTESDPYIIEGWDINASSADGISIIRTDAYFIIRNCILHEGQRGSNYGIYFYNVTNGKIDNTTSYNNEYGIWLCFSQNNQITNCSVYNNSWEGIFFDSSSNNNITNSTVYGNLYYGIWLDYSSNTIITNCTCYNNGYNGIDVSLFSNNGTIRNCVIYNNSGSGIEFWKSSGNTMVGNIFTNDGITIYGSVLGDYIQDIDTTNIVNGKSLYYFLNQNNLNIDDRDIGQLILVNCTNSIIKNVDISRTDVGIQLILSANISITNCTVYNNYYGGISLDFSTNNNISNCTVYNNSYYGIYLYSSSNNNIITDCTVYNNDDGIHLYESSNNNISANKIYNNSYYGIKLYYSSNNNLLYHNNLVNNTYNAYDECINYWNNSTEGNYWSDYNGSDVDGDGIGDTPYNISGGNNKDNYPLMSQIKTAGENHPPTLSNGTVSPLSGDLDTVFTFVVTYTDEDDDIPAYVNVIIDGSAHNITQKKQNNSDNNYIDGCIYGYSTNLSEGFHSYSFEASDGTDINRTVTTYGIKVTEKEEQKTEATQIIYYIILIVIIIVVEILVSAVFLIMRKRTMILKCPKCGTIFKVKRKKEAFKAECPTCGAGGTIKPVPEKKISPEKPTRTLRCPKCEQAFTVEEKTKPFAVKCPHCGKEGTIR